MDQKTLQTQTQKFIKHVRRNFEPSKPLVFWIDLFCGAGGTSTGIHLANAKNVFVAACVNHDANAIKSHFENHPNTLHFTEDIRDFQVVKNLKYLAAELRKAFPGCKLKIWASLECTNFSKAKGGQSRDADSRSLAEHMPMYMSLDPDVFWFENVREFMAWGSLDENGKTICKNNGKDFLKWVESLKAFGYNCDFKLLNSADFGAYQSRERLFLQFPKKGIAFAWPEKTHSKKGGHGGLFDIPKWKPVREILDLDDEGISIFERKKPLSDNTLKRIYAGLIKFVAKGDDAFTKRYNGGKINPEQKVNSLDKPMGTICTNGTHAIVKTNFIKKYFSGRPAGKVIGIDGPAGTVTTVGGQSLVSACHLSTYYGNFGLHSVNGPSPTITTKDRVTKVDVNFIDQQYGNGSAASIENPVNTLTTVPKFALIKCKNFILNPSWGGNNSGIDVPSVTIVARQDKAPLYIVSTELGEIQIPIYDTDSETMIAIKEFMINYGIVDIKMRMLNIPELKQIQGFPRDYKLIGTQTEQKKYIGNAVEVNMAKALAMADYEMENKLKTAA
jgi:DNA (cytosine-5)-methyltransferase 1